MPDLSPVASVGTRTETARGKSAESVGHRAKTMSAEMRAAGRDLPRNATGVIASAIARGLPPESLFAARVSEQPGSDSTSDITGIVTDGSAEGQPVEAAGKVSDAVPLPEESSVAEVTEEVSTGLGQPGD